MDVYQNIHRLTKCRKRGGLFYSLFVLILASSEVSLSAATGFSELDWLITESGFGSEERERNIHFEILNESRWAEVDKAKVRVKGDTTFLFVTLDLARGSRFPFGFHVHIEVFDREGALIETIEQKIRHRHHLSRYLGHLHRAVFTPEKLDYAPSRIGKIKITSHEG